MSVLAIDAGTTGVTALVVTAEGVIGAKGYQEFSQHFPRPGWVEHSPEEIWQATLEAVRSALEQYDGPELRAVVLLERGARRFQRRLPDLLRRVLDPPRPRAVLAELLVALRGDRALLGDHQCGDAGRARVDRQHAHRRSFCAGGPGCLVGAASGVRGG